jgi:hypothetical protein
VGATAQGTFVDFAEPGFNSRLDLVVRIPSVAAVGLQVDGNYTYFSQRTERVVFSAAPFGPIGPGETTREQWAASLHIGPVLSSPTRRGAFRPRASAGLGWYLFATQVDGKLDNSPDSFDISNEYLGRFGWRGDVGAVVFAKRSWGVSADFLYDQIWHLKLESPSGERSQNASYFSVMVGIVVPLSELEEP